MLSGWATAAPPGSMGGGGNVARACSIAGDGEGTASFGAGATATEIAVGAREELRGALDEGTTPALAGACVRSGADAMVCGALDGARFVIVAATVRPAAPIASGTKNFASVNTGAAFESPVETPTVVAA